MKKGLAALAMVAAGTLAAACGSGGSKSSGVASLAGANGSGSNGGATTTTVPKGNPTQLYAKWAQCMRQHGVEMADPTIDSKGVVSINAPKGDPASFQTADSACKSLQEAARVAEGGPKSEKPDPTKLLNFAKCMRAHGLADFPDPGPNGGVRITAGANSDLKPDNPTFQNAQNVCQHILGNVKGTQKIMIGGPPGGGATGGPTGGGASPATPSAGGGK
jgi:hypothetical protein